MNTSICNFRANCILNMHKHPQNQSCQSTTIAPASDYIQQIIIGLLYSRHIAYIVCADRLTVWIILYHLKPGHVTTSKLISICQKLFHTYGTPKELSNDGSPPFSSNRLQQFLKTWYVKYRQSSVAYIQSSDLAKLTVKAAKRIINGNTGPLGSLDNDYTSGPSNNTATILSKALVYP